MKLFILTIIIIIIIIMGSRLCTAGDTLLPGQTLTGNQTLVSGDYEFGFLSSKSFLGIWPVGFPDIVLWVANRGNPIRDFPMSELNISSTGNLVLTQSQELIWSTNLTRSFGSTPTIAVLLDTGNLVLKEKNKPSIIVWQSFDHPTDTWFPRAPLGFNMATEKNIYLTYADYFSGSITFSLELDPSRARGFIIRQLSSNATYHGIFPELIDIVDARHDLVTFNGIKHNDTGTNTIIIEFGYYTFIQLDYSGFISMNKVVRPPHVYFDTLWSDPNSLCDFDSFCGPFSLCSVDGTVTPCVCPYGFHPAYPKDWENGYYSAGCSRNISLNCKDSTNSSSDVVFLQIDNIYKYPDDPQMFVLKDKTECATACLSNCSCTAYSYQNNCCLWFGELQNTVLISSDGRNGDKMSIRLQITAPKHSRHALRFIIMLIIGVAALLVIGLLFVWKYKTSCFTLDQKAIIRDQLVAYSYAETKSITRNFFHKLGEGGFGTVFRGSLPNSTVVAVKRMKNACFEEKQFRTEVQTIGIIQHINLVKLLGFCSEGTKRLLVYEYMPNGSLESLLFSKHSDGLYWNTRYKIMVGIARGLSYLHEECRDCIIHCDIKPENILLDANFCPKIADFGMAKLLGRDFSRALTAMRGTIGYLGPEWIKVACWCIQEMETDRPSMRQVVQMLEGVVEVLMPPIPSFLERLVDLENDSMYF